MIVFEHYSSEQTLFIIAYLQYIGTIYSQNPRLLAIIGIYIASWDPSQDQDFGSRPGKTGIFGKKPQNTLKTGCPLVWGVGYGLVFFVKVREEIQPKNTFIKRTPGEFFEDLSRAQGLGGVREAFFAFWTRISYRIMVFI